MIDPTAPFSTDENVKDKKYLTFKVIDGLGSYLDLISQNNREPALYGAFPKEEMEAHEYTMKNNLILIT